MAGPRLGRWSPGVGSVYSIAAAAIVTAYVLAAFLLAVTLPYHDWDAFAFGAWSRQVATHGSLDPFGSGLMGSQRPLFYMLQGALWSVTGISFTAGRLLSLAFAVVLIAAVWLFVRNTTGRRFEAGLAAIVIVAIPAFSQEGLEGKSDVPVAAALAVVAWLACRGARNPWSLTALGVAAAAAVLTKPTAIVPLAILALVLFVRARVEDRTGVPRLALALGLGLAVGFFYDVVMALRFHTGVVSYLRSGTTDGLFAQLAAGERWDAVLRADVLGDSLRLPLTFSLLYAGARAIGITHRRATLAALPLALVWSIAGPYAAHVAHGPFATAESAFTLIGFTAILAAAVAIRDEDAPQRGLVVMTFAFGAPALALWAYSTAYADRLASAAWPGLAALIALTLAAGIRGLQRLGTSAALAPLPVIALAVWMSLASLDGLHGYDWVVYRSLGLSGLRNKASTMNLVLPSVQSALAAATPVLGPHGTLVTQDPSFQYFLPVGRVDTRLPLHCGDVAHDRVFIMLTSNESEYTAQLEHGLSTPAAWAGCTHPKLRQLTDGSNGYAVFAVGD